ncbi:hypothetical protein ACOME3_000816 [Neoechinorhynchus agilis]
MPRAKRGRGKPIFPAARVKRLMQTNKQVGKLSGKVPVMVSRALELFLRDFVTDLCSVCLDGGAKTVTPTHIKQLVYNEVPDNRERQPATAGQREHAKKYAFLKKVVASRRLSK